MRALVCCLYRHGCSCHCCGRHGLWPSWIWPSQSSVYVAVMDLFWGRYRLWPSLLWPSWFMAVMDLAVMDLRVAIMVCGHHRRWPLPLTYD